MMHIGETEQPRLVNLVYRKSRILKDEWERVLSQAQGLPSSHHCIVIKCLVTGSGCSLKEDVCLQEYKNDGRKT